MKIVRDAGAIISIEPGIGGVDAQHWAEMLMRMYLRWCKRKGFSTEIINHQPGDEAGVSGVSFTVHGAHAYSFLRAENGVHRLIRISPFDANARRHTAFADVFVVPDFGEIKPVRNRSLVRTYTLNPYTMVKNERTGHTTRDVNAVLDGNLDDLLTQ